MRGNTRWIAPMKAATHKCLSALAAEEARGVTGRSDVGAAQRPRGGGGYCRHSVKGHAAVAMPSGRA
jgi:hypothetical protein